MGNIAQTNWIRPGEGAHERLEASFSGAAFSPHRHDTYAIGVTLQGVQSFDYRKATRHAMPGDLVILHPDELHDGRAGTDEGFRYRIIYIRPALLQKILKGVALPFIEGGVSCDRRLLGAVLPFLEDLAHELEPLEFDDALFDLAMALAAVGGRSPRRKPANAVAAEDARLLLHEHVEDGVSLSELEQVTGHDRWELSRDFRALYGTSPGRYLTLRRLDRARDEILTGQSLADAAMASGFADQSHFSRHFRKAYGLTPRQWAQRQARS